MNLFLESLLSADPRPRISVVATGAGADFVHQLWSIPGISRVFVGATLPYAKEATIDALGYEPDKFVSTETAIALSHTAYAQAHAAGGGKPFGVGITASVATTKLHRGEPRLIVAVTTDDRVLVELRSLPQASGREARRNDDVDVTRAVLHLLEQAMRPGVLYLGTATHESLAAFFEYPVFDLAGRHPVLGIKGRNPLFFPGAFNPLHFGHEGLARSAERASGRSVIYEITADQPHKPALTVQEMVVRGRALQRRGHTAFFSRGAPKYIDKAREYPGAHFVIGVDALDRMLDPKWCPVEPMLEEFDRLGTRFWVGARDGVSMLDVLLGRLGQERVVSRGWQDKPNPVQVLFRQVEGSWDVSSTELREEKRS